MAELDTRLHIIYHICKIPILGAYGEPPEEVTLVGRDADGRERR